MTLRLTLAPGGLQFIRHVKVSAVGFLALRCSRRRLAGRVKMSGGTLAVLMTRADLHRLVDELPEEHTWTH